MKIWPLFVFIFFVTGCDTIHGYRQYTYATIVPDEMAVRNALRSLQEIEKITAHDVPDSRYFSLYKGIRTAKGYPQFSILTKEAFIVIALGRKNGTEIALYRYWMNRKPTEEEITKTKALITRVQTALYSTVQNWPPESDFKSSDDKNET